MTRPITVVSRSETPFISKLSSLEWYQAGVKLHGQGLYGEAAQALRNATSLKRDYVEAFHLLAICQYLDGWSMLAEWNFMQVLYLAPEHPEALYFLSEIYIEQSKFEQAITALNKALDIDPDYELAFEKLVNAYRLVASSILNEDD